MDTFEDYNDHTNNWNDYISNINDRYDQMYSLINYNQFVNEEIRNMDRKIRFLTKDLEKQKSDNNELVRKYDTVKENYHEIKNKFEKSKGKSDTSTSKRMRDDSKWLSSEKRKRPRNYGYLEKDIKKRNERIKIIFYDNYNLEFDEHNLPS